MRPGSIQRFRIRPGRITNTTGQSTTSRDARGLAHLSEIDNGMVVVDHHSNMLAVVLCDELG